MWDPVYIAELKERIVADLIKLGRYEIGYKSGKVYLKAGDKVPKGAQVQSGEKGGKYYVKPAAKKTGKPPMKKRKSGDNPTQDELRNYYVKRQKDYERSNHPDPNDDYYNSYEDDHPDKK